MLHISVIIPALNEAANLRKTLECVVAAGADEVIVVDGGSSDETRGTATEFTDHVLSSPRGRAVQMNRGAAKATGDVLLFLHADTLLPTGGIEMILQAFTDPRTVGGAFRLKVDMAGLPIRVVEKTVNIRSRICKCPYGDQGLFIRREVFEKLQGFSDLPIMEDVDLVRRMKKAGRLAILPRPVTTSGRRWAANGVWRTTLTNWTAILMYWCRRSPQQIRAYYDRRLGTRSKHTTIDIADTETPDRTTPTPVPGVATETAD